MYRSIVKKIFKPPVFLWPFKFIFLIGGLCGYFLLNILKPLIFIRVGCLQFDRIGHLSLNTELYLRERVIDKRKIRQWHIFISGKPINYQLLTMIRRKVFVINNRIILWIYETLHLIFSNSNLWIDLSKFSKVENFAYHFDNIVPQLMFTSKEEDRGSKVLKSLGIPSDFSFVCFHARDNAYLAKTHKNYSEEEWAYHDYRDCEVNNYLQAAEYLASLGIYVIRMGYIVKKELKSNNPYIIDYATHCRSDFADIYLTAKCKFFIASEGGLSSVAWIFNVPVAYSNGAPPGGMAGWRKTDIYMPKKLWSRALKRFLTFQEIIDLGADKWFTASAYKEAGIEVVENTPEEILALTKEMNERLDGTWIVKEENEELQKQYRLIFPEKHRCRKFSSCIGAEFLRDNQKLIK